MKTVQHAIEVAVPLHTAFEQLSHFENYPQFMTGIKQVTQLSDTKAHWVMELNGQRQEFDAEITECREDERVAWKSSGTPMLSEVITLRAKGDNRTHITAQLAADAQALLPSDAHAEESLSKLLKADLNRFKQYAEQHPSGDLPQSATARSISDPNGLAGTDTSTGAKSAKGARGGNGKSARSATGTPADLAQNAGSRGASGSGITGSGGADSDFETSSGAGRVRSASGAGTSESSGSSGGTSSGSGQIRGAQAGTTTDSTTGSSGSKSGNNRRSNS